MERNRQGDEANYSLETNENVYESRKEKNNFVEDIDR